jgi:hypothetical protein
MTTAMIYRRVLSHPSGVQGTGRLAMSSRDPLHGSTSGSSSRYYLPKIVLENMVRKVGLQALLRPEFSP